MGPWRAPLARSRRTAPTLSQTLARRNEDPVAHPPRTSGDLDDARLDRLEPVGDLGIVARDDQPRGAGESVDRLEGREHLGQARDDLDGLARLHVAIEVRRVGGEHDRPASGLNRDDLQARGVAADPVHADPGQHLAVAVNDPDAVGVVQRHEPRQRPDVRRLSERRIVAVRARPEGHLVPLDPVLRPGKQTVPRPVVVVEVGDERDGHVPWLHAGALDHRGRAHVTPDPALPRVVVEEPGVHEDRVRAAEDQPDVVVERDRGVRRLAVEELAGRRVPLPVLERVDFVHGSPRSRGRPSSGSIVWQAVAAHLEHGGSQRLMSGRLNGKIAIVSRKDLLDTPEEEWDRVIAVDLKSMFLATRAAVPAMLSRGGGAVVCVSSIAALRGHGRTAYATAKAGVIGFVRSVAVQLGPKGIRVNAIAPGPVWTPMVQDLGDAARERRRRASPLGTEGTGWDVGWGAVYLASEEARWVTGQTLIIDAGLTVTTPEGSLGGESR